MVEKMKALFVEEEGQGMTEYGLVLGIIAVAAVGALVALRGEIVEMFNNVKAAVENRPTGDGTSGS
ncbi:MAG TPA: Flp family type IVb pilin [Bacillus sp. (in: firmicutes)]|uniref:Flp family type IVb pilin n=1 Tax=Bacillus litorisediminis TaxID=2922713 RepID=UPI001FABBA76|nr:Flp family type IVb pilin [Bacillus litorisediminis]HWO77056.1 Flp family type IVb pilin [Bacillus sp. (in: firmicutes)]